MSMVAGDLRIGMLVVFVASGFALLFLALAARHLGGDAERAGGRAFVRAEAGAR